MAIKNCHHQKRDERKPGPFDLSQYDNEDPAELKVKIAGTSALYLAIMEATDYDMMKLSGELASQNRRRFHKEPRKTMWRGKWA